MYYVIKQSTDLRDRRTQIKKCTNKNNAIGIAKNMGSGEFTYKDPESARNFHHSFASVYELKGRVNKKDKVFRDYGSPTYPNTSEDQLAYYIKEHGRKVEY